MARLIGRSGRILLDTAIPAQARAALLAVLDRLNGATLSASGPQGLP